MARKGALGPGGAVKLIRPGEKVEQPPVTAEEISLRAKAAQAVVAPGRHGAIDDLFTLALERVYAIPVLDQTPEMRQLLVDVCDRLDRLACIGKYAGMNAPRNSTAIHNALKTRVILTLGPQVRRSETATVSETRKEIIVRHVAPGEGKPN